MYLQALRESKHLTQVHLAERISVTQQYISKLEKGKINGLPLGKLNKIAKILNVTECELLKILRKDEIYYLKLKNKDNL